MWIKNRRKPQELKEWLALTEYMSSFKMNGMVFLMCRKNIGDRKDAIRPSLPGIL